MNKYFFLSITLVAITTASFSQEDKIAGVYVDGVKVDSLTCYSFGDMDVVIPWNDAYKDYGRLFVNVAVRVEGYSKYQPNIYSSFTRIAGSSEYKNPGVAKKMENGKAIFREKIFKKGEQKTVLPENRDRMFYGDMAEPLSRNYLQFYDLRRKTDKETELYLEVTVGGSVISSYVYENGVKTGLWNNETLYTVKIPLRNKTGLYNTVFKTVDGRVYEKTVDLTKPCIYQGEKLEDSLKAK